VSAPRSRVDLFAAPHRALRVRLFEVTTRVAVVEIASTAAVDAMVAQVEEALAFLDEHAGIEDRLILPAVRAISPALARDLASEHRGLDRLQLDVEGGADDLAAAPIGARCAAATELARRLDRLTRAHLAHMGREETEANPVLWGALADAELVALRERAHATLAPARQVAWAALLAAAATPAERVASPDPG